MKTADGFTIIEVIVALVILLILVATVSTAMLSSLNGNRGASIRSVSTQITNTLNARVAQHVISLDSGESQIFVFNPTDPIRELSLSTTPASCAAYLTVAANRTQLCATVANDSTFSPRNSTGTGVLGGSGMDMYTTTVCWNNQGVKCASSKSIY